MDGLTKGLSIVFAGAVFLLVAVITAANGLSLLIILKRSLLASLLFGVLGGVIGYLVINLTAVDNQQQKQEINSVSKETAAQQYAAQSKEAGEAEVAENKEQTDEDQKNDEFEPLDLEEIDYDEQKEVEELAEQDPEKLANMVKNIQEE